MALMAFFYFLSLVRNLHGILAAPALYKFSAVSMTSTPSGSEPTSSSTAYAGSLSPFAVIPWENQYAFSVSIPTATTTVIVHVAEQSTTVTLPPASTTVTTYITVPVSSQTPSSSPVPTSIVGTLGPAKYIWVAPLEMDDLTPFGVTGFPTGKNNLEIVTEIPANASADGSNVASTQSDNSTSILQTFFPRDSIDPARRPIGGAQFYASPLDISNARNVSLRYSVFFPHGFDFVLGGKMPGLYAGRTGCSGGDPATTCFSTRLMWRPKGAGELYMYAPKDKQSGALCSAPGSVCDADYGLSVGRGSFTWATGDWTTVQQTVVLNTPGLQDGCFTLDVNGQRVIDRNDVLYRDTVADDGSDQDPPPRKRPTSTKPAKPTVIADPPKDDGGLLGGLLRGLGSFDLKSVVSFLYSAPITSESDSQPTITISPQHTFNDPPLATTFADAALSKEQIGFIGIFFSTFFGGHGDKYATPRDQYIWFKDFALAYNS